MSESRGPLFTPRTTGRLRNSPRRIRDKSILRRISDSDRREFGWPRSEFSLAIAIQNLAWGFGSPFFGAFSEKLGDRKAIVLGAVLYSLGLVLTAGASTAFAIQFYEILVGFGVAGTGFGVILAVVGRASAPEHRAMSLAIATASGSAGQIVGPVVAVFLLESMEWQSVF